VTSLLQASLSAEERALLEGFIARLRRSLGRELHAVWLFGSRARGEAPAEESDVDLMVFVDDASWDGRMRVRKMLDIVAHDLGLDALAWSFSIHVHNPAWLEQRRAIESFFIAEVDRDKIVLSGSA
jgi:predicted nucleotidyltransferase